MSKKIIEGLWDCPYCGAKGIGGLKKQCPNCGHPQDEGTRFYMGQEIQYLDKEKAEQYGNGADWICDYCGSLNPVHAKFCTNCGSAREEAKRDYFNRDQQGNGGSESPKTSEPKQAKKTEPVRKKNGGGMKFLLGVAAVIAVLFFIFMPRSADVKVAGKSWTRAVDIEAWTTVQESDWDVPDGGRINSQRKEIHHYNQVLDHYDTKTRQVAEQVYDGEDVHTSYSDNGDGTFSENTYSTPRYRTEYRTETYQEPVYRDDPVYATKYYYEIERWIPSRRETSEGGAEDPYWPDYTLAENERESDYSESYSITLETEKGKTYYVNLNEEQWNRFKVGDGISITTSGGRVTEINGEKI